MDDVNLKSHGTQPPPQSSDRGHPLPRRTTADKSVTLRHHQLARDASNRNSLGRSKVSPTAAGSQRRNSSGESYETGQSDTRRWFDKSNKNAKTALDPAAMDVDSPFYQRETDSSGCDAGKDLDVPPLRGPGFRHSDLVRPNTLARAQSSSADDYRSVIDDLTIENKRLKDELKRYKQYGPDMLKKEKLFEIKVHGLPQRKKRELEATLRDFAAGLGGSTEASPQRKKSSRHNSRPYGTSEALSKHPSSSSSHSRPVDSAYASMSTGAPSMGTSLGQASRARTSSEQKVESYLQDIPEGLYPRNMMMAENEKKKLVVRRLEQLFTGRIAGRNLRTAPEVSSAGSMSAAGAAPTHQQALGLTAPLPLASGEPAREARILMQDGSARDKSSRSRENLSTSNSHGDQTDSGAAGSGSSGGANGTSNGANSTSPQNGMPEQRATRPRDLDPDRTQVPTDNVEYIRHLGLVPPELLPEATRAEQQTDVSPDADGWVYLNLLSNMAQLHMLNVSPSFIRAAVSERSSKFQLSPDGRKIRWRGGMEGTRFSSDSSGENSQKSPLTDDTDASNSGCRKKQRTLLSGDVASAPTTNNLSNFGAPNNSNYSSGAFHYKPMFIRQSSSNEQSSMDDSESDSGDQVEESNLGYSRWGFSRSGSAQRRKRKIDGAIIYYNGAPFCTDLSGDPGDASPTTYLTGSGAEPSEQSRSAARPLIRTSSGSSIKYRPLSDVVPRKGGVDVDVEEDPGLMTDDDDSCGDAESNFPWSDNPKLNDPVLAQLESCGLGGVLPDDHFLVFVTTKRPKQGSGRIVEEIQRSRRDVSEETTDSMIHRLASMSTSSPLPYASATTRDRVASPAVEIEYLQGNIRKLQPVALPPPVVFFPPFSDSSDDGSFSLNSEEDEDERLASSSEELISRRANPHLSENTNPDDVHFDSDDNRRGQTASSHLSGSRSSERMVDGVLDNPLLSQGGRAMERKSAERSSVATAGGQESGYSSSAEEDGE